ncbi:MAG: antibiotic biosynthesis monooxygenase [bacterium]|nr:antibiotic biosynthesis monooxygenase [bacterium]
MFAVIFEVRPKAERRNEYLEAARELKPELERIDGFVHNERFAARSNEGLILSFSTWRDEKALIRWRTLAQHHLAQERGRFEIFADYRLRVGEIVEDSAAAARDGLRGERFDETVAGDAHAAAIEEITPSDGDAPAQALSGALPDRGANLVAGEIYDSIYTPGKALTVTWWRDLRAASAHCAQRRLLGNDGARVRCRTVRIIRDYGMFDRREAPQYYADVR